MRVFRLQREEQGQRGPPLFVVKEKLEVGLPVCEGDVFSQR